MTLKCYAVYDEKAQAYASPFYFHHDGQAIRAFSDEAGRKDSRISEHSSDYALYCLGEFDDRAGLLKGVNEPRFLVRAADFVAKNGGS